MPKVFEVFGYPIGDKSKEAENARKNAICPFMGVCDGGGNRYLSHINLEKKPELRKYFISKKSVHSGVCSIRLQDDESPWIVCPHRLLVMKSCEETQAKYQKHARNLLLTNTGYQSGSRIGVWPEVKMKYECNDGNIKKSFDYTFDYVLMKLGKVEKSELEAITGEPWNRLRRTLENTGYTLANRGNAEYVEDFPTDAPMVVEIMTSSTSGGNEKKRSTIPLAFEDAILGKDHLAPGINYRQVWARMVSQLIVKSQVALEWGGRTYWVLQDVLVDYISSTTALSIRQFLAKHPSEVNIISLSYGKSEKESNGIIELNQGELYAGPISSSGKTNRACFQDMIKAPVCPPKSRLIALLTKRRYSSIVIQP